VTRHTRFKFFVLQEEIPHEAFDTMSIYVLKADGELKYKIVEFRTSMLVKHADFKQPNEVLLEVDLGTGFYVIIPATFNPKHEGRYQMRVIANNPHSPLVLLKPRPTVSIKGEWKGTTAGGTTNNKTTWKNNTQFKLLVKKTMTLTITLTQVRPDNESNMFGIGFLIFGGNGEKIDAPSPTNTILKGDYRPDRSVQQTVSIPGKATPYVVVPSTFEAKQECEFTIVITSEADDLMGNVSLEKL